MNLYDHSPLPLLGPKRMDDGLDGVDSASLYAAYTLVD